MVEVVVAKIDGVHRVLKNRTFPDRSNVRIWPWAVEMEGSQLQIVGATVPGHGDGVLGRLVKPVAAKVEVPQLRGGDEPLRERPTESVAGKAELFQLVEEGAAGRGNRARSG